MARGIVPVLLVLLAACGPRTAPGRVEAAPQFWRPGITKESWLIGGYLDTVRVPAGLGSRPEHQVFITVNGRVVMQGPMPRDRAIELSGRAEGSGVAAICSPEMVARATVQVRCIVMVANERAATLTFTAGPRRG